MRVTSDSSLGLVVLSKEPLVSQGGKDGPSQRKVSTKWAATHADLRLTSELVARLPPSAQSQPQVSLVRCPFDADLALTWDGYVPSQRQVSLNWAANQADLRLTFSALRGVIQPARKSASSQVVLPRFDVDLALTLATMSQVSVKSVPNQRRTRLT